MYLVNMAERFAAALGRLVGKVLKIFIRFFDDVLLLAGCGCVLYGLSMWNIVVTWIAGGLMLIGLAFLVGKVRGRNAID